MNTFKRLAKAFEETSNQDKLRKLLVGKTIVNIINEGETIVLNDGTEITITEGDYCDLLNIDN